MTTTTQPITVPAMDLLLSGLVWSATPGTPTAVTYCFLQQVPNPLFAPLPGNPTEDVGWTPLSVAQQALVLQGMAEISSVANLTFQASTNPATAQILFGTDKQIASIGVTSYAGTPVINATQKQLVQTHIELSTTMPSGNAFLEVALHEIANSTGLQDLAGDTHVGMPQNSLTYSIESYASGANAYDYFAPGFIYSTTPQILDIAAWQYLYGANQNGFTGSTIGVAESQIGNDHSYAFSDTTAPMTVWIGANVSGANRFDFSACTGILTIDLTPGTVSSTGQNQPGASITVGTVYYDISNAPYQNVGIAYGTMIDIGIGNGVAGATLIANENAGTTSLLIGKAADSFVAGGGFDIFIASGGASSAVFHDPAADYSILAGANGGLMVVDHAATPKDGTAVLSGNFYSLQFSDKTITETPSSNTSVSAILGTAAWVQNDLATLQSFVSDGYVSSVTLTDAGTAALSVTAAQSVADAAALGALSGSFSLTIDAMAANATATGSGGGHAVTVILLSSSASYTVTSAGDGTSFTLTNGTSVDHFSGVTALQFAAGQQAIVASETPVLSGGVSSAEVAALYAAVLARTPDAGGLAFYENSAAHSSGAGLLTYAEWFLNSPEYSGNSAHNYGATSDGDAKFITDIYQNLLHRAPEAGAVQFYQSKVIDPMLQGLTAGTTAYAAADLAAHAQVLTYFGLSAEFFGDVRITAQQPADAQHWLILI